jgi:hypothetical protein
MSGEGPLIPYSLYKKLFSGFIEYLSNLIQVKIKHLTIFFVLKIFSSKKMDAYK